MPAHNVGFKATELRMPILCTSDTTDGEGNMLVNLSDACTRLNGRLYRNARTYRVSFSPIVSPTQDGGATSTYEFYTLPNTWFVHGAVKYAYQTYMQMMQDELDAGVPMAKWHDFKINEQNVTGVYESSGVALTDGTADGGYGALPADEAISDSSVTDAGGTSQGFHILGNLANSYNIFREFANRLNYRPQPGTTSSTQPYDGLLDLDDADVLAERGDLAPYDRDWSVFLPDDATVDDDAGQQILVHRGTIVVDDNAGSIPFSTRAFDAPLGLVWVRKYVNGAEAAFLTTQLQLVATLSPGDYKGVHSHSLTE